MLDRKEALRRLILDDEPEEVAEALSICLNEDVAVVWDKAVRLGLDQLRRGTVASVIREASADNPFLLEMARLYAASKQKLQEKREQKPPT